MSRLLSRNTSTGAIFIELAVTLPIILMLIGAILFLSELINAKGQLRLAVSEGPRLATTRGNMFFFSSGDENKTANSELDTFVEGNQAGVLPSILYLGISEPTARSNYSTSPTQWHMLSDETSPVYSFSTAHPIDVYALAYTYGILRIGIPGIKYPCDPNPTNPRDGRGCLECKVATPLSNKNTCTKHDGTADTSSACPYDRALPDTGIVCMYHPAGPAAQIIDSMIRFFTRGNGGLAEMFLSASTYPPGLDTGGGGLGGGGPTP